MAWVLAVWSQPNRYHLQMGASAGSLGVLGSVFVNPRTTCFRVRGNIPCSMLQIPCSGQKIPCSVEQGICN